MEKEIKNGKATIGQFFTPDFVAEFMVSNLLKWIRRGKTIDSLKFKGNLEVLEPSVGNGVFLKFISQMLQAKITAYEIDPTLKTELEERFPYVDFHFQNFLGSSLEKKYDLIIGNPPYLGQNYNAELFQEYLSKFPICKKYFIGNMDLFYYWIHLGIEKLKPGGYLSFITTNYWITKSEKTGIKYLKPHILDKTFLIQYIDLSELNIFNSAKGQHNCIFILKKKTESEKLNNKDEKIQIIKIRNSKPEDLSHTEYNQEIFKSLLKGIPRNEIQTYTSAITNNDLEPLGNWNLLYPKEIKEVMSKIENICLNGDFLIRLKDRYLIRNGLIFVKDKIFILKLGKEINTKEGKWVIEIEDKDVIIPESEKSILKRVYKSKSIIPYGYKEEELYGYALFFNKNEFEGKTLEKKIDELEESNPVLSTYIKQYEKQLKEILKNANENPENFYFPRRGNFIKMKNSKGNRELIDLEPMYDSDKKIFFRYIMKDNVFGFTSDSYYATSDTYFIWPKLGVKEQYDYPFFLAYLNSKLVSFIFKAKNIKIKRSKTQLEQELILPNLERFKSEEDKELISLINLLSSFLMQLNRSNANNEYSGKLQQTNEKCIQEVNDSQFIEKILKDNIKRGIKQKNFSVLQKNIDSLFFKLFNLDENYMDSLVNKYYG